MNVRGALRGDTPRYMLNPRHANVRVKRCRNVVSGLPTLASFYLCRRNAALAPAEAVSTPGRVLNGAIVPKRVGFKRAERFFQDNVRCLVCVLLQCHSPDQHSEFDF